MRSRCAVRIWPESRTFRFRIFVLIAFGVIAVFFGRLLHAPSLGAVIYSTLALGYAVWWVSCYRLIHANVEISVDAIKAGNTIIAPTSIASVSTVNRPTKRDSGVTLVQHNGEVVELQPDDARDNDQIAAILGTITANRQNQ